MLKLRLRAGSGKSRMLAYFLDGLAGPSDLLSGKYEAHIRYQKSSVEDAWREVGGLLGDSVRAYAVKAPPLTKLSAKSAKKMYRHYRKPISDQPPADDGLSPAPVAEKHKIRA